MRKSTGTLTLIAVMTLLLFTLSAQSQSTSGTVTAQDVQKETKEMINALQQYTFDQRDQAVKEINQALKKLDGQIDELESRVDSNWDNMTKAARQKYRGDLKTLRQQRIELAERYGSFKNSSINAWEQMKKGFSNAYQSMSDSWKKAIDEYNTDNM
jgi:peptidoglycan hydrolase CwlO-like protein